MIWWILLGALALIVCILLTLLIAPIRIKIECVNGWHFSLYIVGVRVFRLSSPFDSLLGEDKEKSSAEQTKKPKEKSQEGEKKSSAFSDSVRGFFEEEGIEGVLDFFKRLYDIFGKTAGNAKRFVTIRKLALCVRVGADEADDTALYYAGVSSALSVALGLLSSVVRIKHPVVRVVPDFISPSSDVKMRMVLWIWPFGIIASVALMAIRAMVLWFTTFGKSRQNTKNHIVQS